ncbi:MAG TPA: DNA-directed RNA polymerase subunit beta', partial [Alphaproteobacteria bacterium]|nr:DNA-directed RNA polymerase subunit beta' [Alphaproteobacteria bacterium]
LTMRTFHIGGAAQVAEQSFVDASHDGAIRIVNRNIVRDSTGALRVMGRNAQVLIVDANGQERASFKLPFGGALKYDEGEAVKRGERLVEWDPYTLPILTEKAGMVRFEGLVEGVSLKEVTDEATGISSKTVVDWRANPRGTDLRPAISLTDDKGATLKFANKQDARYLLPVDAILSVEEGQQVREGDILARIPTEGAKTRDITGGLPRVAELFEARRPKDAAIVAEIDGWIEFGKDYKSKRRILIKPKDESLQPLEYMIPKGKHVTVQEGDFVEKGDYIVDGNPAPHDILRVKGIEALAAYLVNEIQEVYRLQGVKINDKHIEVIVRQMLQKIEVEDGGETTLVAGEQLDQLEYDEINAKAIAEGLKPASGKPVLLGITKASLQTRSFIS